MVAATNEFVVYCYKNGLRDPNGINHIIQSCFIAAGSFSKLWFRSNESESLGILGSPSYSTSGGYSVLAGTHELRSHNANLCNTNDCCLFIHNLTNNGIKDFFGTTLSSNRYLLHPRWLDDNNLYLDAGNTGTARVFTNNGTNSTGLIIGTKLNSTVTAYQRGTQIAVKTNAPTTGLVFPSEPITVMAKTLSDTATTRLIGGFGTGRAIPGSAIAGFTTAWNAIQQAAGRLS
jgi:hypothetical protein